MTRKKKLKMTLLACLFFLALGAWLLHSRIHPYTKAEENFIPFVAGIVSVFCLPLLFYFRPTIVLAYLINSFLAIIGTITMAHFSIAHFKGPVEVSNIVLNTLFADIIILWGKFALGKAIFDLEFLKSEADIAAKGRFFRYPNMGWWWVHLFGASAVYVLGNIFWR